MTRVVERNVICVHIIYAFNTSMPSNEMLHTFLLSAVQI